MKKFFLGPRFLLPLVIVLGLSVVTMRLADVWHAAVSGDVRLQAAHAEGPSLAHEAQANPAAEAAPPPTAAIKEPPPMDDVASPAEMDVLKQLSDRREQLEKRSRALDTREALLKVSERRIEQKLKELEVLRQQVQALVGQADEAQQAQMDNLVKIYETMKPTEAARIFETLEMPVLLGVLPRMKPARTALILARMPPEKAKEITIEMTRRDQLPNLD